MYQSTLYQDQLIRVRLDLEDRPENWEAIRALKEVLKSRFEQKEVLAKSHEGSRAFKSTNCVDREGTGSVLRFRALQLPRPFPTMTATCPRPRGLGNCLSVIVIRSCV